MSVNNDHHSSESPSTALTDLPNESCSDDDGDDFKMALQMSLESQEISAELTDNMCSNKRAKNTVEKPRSNKKCYKCSSKIPVYRRRIVCKCGHVFCAPHSRSDDHSCSFDYKAEYKLLLEKQNNKVVASRCDRI